MTLQNDREKSRLDQSRRSQSTSRVKSVRCLGGVISALQLQVFITKGFEVKYWVYHRSFLRPIFLIRFPLSCVVKSSPCHLPNWKRWDLTLPHLNVCFSHLWYKVLVPSSFSEIPCEISINSILLCMHMESFIHRHQTSCFSWEHNPSESLILAWLM